MKYEDALEWYDRAIVLDNNNAIYFSNRAFTHIKMEKLGAAIEDATQAIELDPKYAKVRLILTLLSPTLGLLPSRVGSIFTREI